MGLLYLVWILWSQVPDSLPPIYLTIVCHNEEPGVGYPDFTVDTAAFWLHRQALVAFAETVAVYGAALNYQSDWNFLLAATLLDTGTATTNGKNFLRYLVEDLGVEADPHTHETEYNYADVAYLMAQLLGGEPSHTVGGYIAAPPEQAQIEYFRDTLFGWHFPYAWKAEILWGGSFPGHEGDDSLWTSGVWRPQDDAHYLVHDPTAPLPEVGGYNRRWDGLLDLLAKQETGELQPGRLYTQTLFLEQNQMLDTQFVRIFRDRLRFLDTLTQEDRIVWAHLSEVVETWQTVYDERPNLYSYRYGDITEPLRDTLWLVMDDGVRLEAVRYLPVDPVPPGGFPALLFVHGLGGSVRTVEPRARFYARHGYVTLAYSVRGQGHSEGLSTLMGPRERQDLAQVVQWLRSLPEVNDTLVGVTGVSQGGFHSWYAAVDSLGVRAVAPENSVPLRSESRVRAGCYLSPVTVGMLPTEQVRVDTHAFPLYRWLLADEYDSVLALVSRGRDFDSTQVAASDSRFLMMAAWQDHIFWANRLPGAHAVAPHDPLLYLGTGGHGSDEDPQENALRALLRWLFFEAHLKGHTTVLDTLPRVLLALGPDWHHRAMNHWPTTQVLDLYLREDSTLSPHPPGGSLADSVFHLVHQRLWPSYTWPVAVNDYFRHVPQAFALRQCTWRSVPLVDTLVLLGAPRVQAFVRSPAPRFQVSFQLYDEPPAGPPRLLTQGSTGFRSNPDTTAWHPVTVVMHLVGWEIPPGHRLLLRWTTVNFSEEDSSLWVIPFWEEGRLDLSLSAARPALLRLPLLEPYRVAEAAQNAAPLRLWPLPARTWLQVTLQRIPAVLDLYDASGRRIRTWRLTTPVAQGFVGDLPTGVYVLRVRGKPGVARRVLILR